MSLLSKKSSSNDLPINNEYFIAVFYSELLKISLIYYIKIFLTTFSENDEFRKWYLSIWLICNVMKYSYKYKCFIWYVSNIILDIP